MVLVKHSLPQIARDRPRREWHLSQEGRARCRPLGEQLRKYRPARIFTSPEPKAHETATLLAAALTGISTEVVEELREHDDGDGPYQVAALFRAGVGEFFRRPAEALFGPETADAAYLRFASAVDSIGLESGAVVVAHGRVISLFVSRRAGLDAFTLWQRLGLPAFVVLRLPDYEVLDVVERV